MAVRVRGAGWAAQQQREGHQSYTGDGARSAELCGSGNRDEPSLETIVEKLTSHFHHPKDMLKKCQLLPDYRSSKP